MNHLNSTQLDPHLCNAAMDYFNTVYGTLSPIEELLGRSASPQLNCTRTVTTSVSSVSAGRPTPRSKAALMAQRRSGVRAHYTSSSGAFRRATAEHTPNRQLNNARHQDGYVPDYVNGHLEMLSTTSLKLIHSGRCVWIPNRSNTCCCGSICRGRLGLWC